MQHFTSHINHFHFDFNSVVWNLERVPHAVGQAMLSTLRRQLEEISRWLAIHEREDVAQATFGTRMVVRQYGMVLEALVAWAQLIESEYATMEPS